MHAQLAGRACQNVSLTVPARPHGAKPDLCASILRHLRAAAGPTTKLLIVDMVLAHACYDDYDDDGQEAIPGAERSLAPEGSPLLANLGRASASGYLLDLSVRARPYLTYLVR